MPYLRQSTSQVIRFGPCVDKTDGVTAETGLTLAQADMQLSKDGAAFAQKSAAGNASHDTAGWYSTTLSTTDTATVGELRLQVDQDANMLPVWDRWWVLEEAIYDALYGASAGGFDSSQRVDVGSFLGTAVVLSTGLPDVNIASTDNIALSVQQKLDVNTEADTALTEYAGPTKTEMDTAHGLLATEAKQDIIDGIVDDLKAATILASGLAESSGSNSSTQIQTDLAEATNDHYNLMTILITSGAEAGQARVIDDYVGSTGVVIWAEVLTGTPADGVSFVILAAGTSAGEVWDQLLTGSTHNINTSAGKRLREISQATVLASGIIATVTNSHTFTLDSGAVATEGYYHDARLSIVEGTGAGQSRIISDYTAGRVVTLSSDFTTNPDTSSLYEIDAANAHVSLSDLALTSGFIATYTNTTTVTLAASAVATTDYYVGAFITLTHGTGSGQTREIIAYTSGRVATLSPALTTALDTATAYHVHAGASRVAIADAIWDEAKSGHTTADTYGKLVQDIETDATAILEDVDGIGGSAMRGTDNAALAVVLGALADAASAGDPTNSETVIQYLKQLVNTLEGTAGIPVLLAAADPANNVSIVEMIRRVFDDTAVIGAAGAGLTNINLPDQTMNITGNITGNLSGSVGSVTGAVGSVAGNVDGSVASNTELGPSEVNAQVVDALNVDTYAEPGQGAPAATASLVAKIGYLYKGWRNRTTQTASQYSLYNDDATTLAQKATLSDDNTTADKGEIGTGP